VNRAALATALLASGDFHRPYPATEYASDTPYPAEAFTKTVKTRRF
jgi:hypothetical protein